MRPIAAADGRSRFCDWTAAQPGALWRCRRGNHAPRHCTTELIPMAVLQNLEQAAARIAALEAQLALANKPKAITMKVSEKGAISIYGLGRFPITLYRGQME